MAKIKGGKNIMIIKFRDLSLTLKIAASMGILYAGLLVLAFLSGFLEAI